MRLLFEIDYKNYKENWTVGKRPSARAIIIKDNEIGDKSLIINEDIAEIISSIV